MELTIKNTMGTMAGEWKSYLQRKDGVYCMRKTGKQGQFLSAKNPSNYMNVTKEYCESLIKAGVAA